MCTAIVLSALTFFQINYTQSHHVLHQAIDVVVQVHLPEGILMMLIFLYQLGFMVLFLDDCWRGCLVDDLHSV
jgi:hypothetical protein